MDSLPASLAFGIGVLAGFQGIHERYRKDALRACRTWPGLLYLLTRGGAPALLFVLAYEGGLIERQLWLWSAAIGSGSEVFLRSQFYIRQAEPQPGHLLELVRGPLDLLRWYQNLFLEAAANKLAEARRAFVERHVPNVGFPKLCELVLVNKDAYGTDSEITKQLEADIQELSTKFQEEDDDSEATHRRYRMKLGYRVRSIAGEAGFLTLLAKSREEE